MQEVSLFIQHHPVLCLTLLSVTLITVIVEYLRLRRQAAQISPSTAVLLINRDNAVVLDIRSKDAWLAGHITGAISLPLSDLQHNKKIDRFRTQPIILACGTGNDSRQAATQLQQKGLNVRILSGGMQGWLAAGLPVIRS